jgi:phosphoribosyl-dephospho-CoA transferase
VREDGVGVNWRELHAGLGEVLIKTSGGVTLQKADLFLSNETQS